MSSRPPGHYNRAGPATATGEKAIVKHIFISPHSDDVALSCGGRIMASADAGDDMLILNIFTSDVQELRGEHGNAETLFADSLNSDRTLEDRSAWAFAGVEAHYAKLPEALLRKKFPFSLKTDAPAPEIADQLHEVLAGYARSHPGAAFHFPAGIGNHVDHLACTRAAFRLLDEGIVERIFLYEDTPYGWLKFIRDQYYRALLSRVTLDDGDRDKAFRPDGVTLPAYLAGKQPPFPKGKLLFTILFFLNLFRGKLHRSYRAKVDVIAIGEAHLKKKADLLFHYRSQIPMLFGDRPEAMLEQHHASFAQEVTMEITRGR